MKDREPSLDQMRAKALIIDDPKETEGAAAMKLEAMRRVLARLPKKLQKKLRGKESTMAMMTRLRYEAGL